MFTAPGSIPPFVCLYVLSSMKYIAVSSVLKVGVTSVTCLQLGCSISIHTPTSLAARRSFLMTSSFTTLDPVTSPPALSPSPEESALYLHVSLILPPCCILHQLHLPAGSPFDP